MLFNIQLLRALAAYLVVFVHLQPFVLMVDGPAELFAFGNAGVDIFFVISGFIMVFTTQRREHSPGLFFKHRIARVVPLYWFVTFIVFIIAIVTTSLLQGTHATFLYLLKSTFFIPFQRVDGAVAPIVFVGWTLNYEMFFYVLFTIALSFPTRRIGLIILFVSLSGLVLIGAIIHPAAVEVRFYTRAILLEFGFGVSLGLLFPYLPNHQHLRWPTVLLGCFSFAATFWTPVIWSNIDRTLLWGVPAFFIVLSALILDRLSIRVPSIIRLLGDASYSIYLTHFFVTQMLVKLAGRLHLANPVSIALFLLISLLAVGLVGVLVHHAIERPLTKIVQQLLGIVDRRSAGPIQEGRR